MIDGRLFLRGIGILNWGTKWGKFILQRRPARARGAQTARIVHATNWAAIVCTCWRAAGSLSARRASL
jgi:hypothetical protein